MSHPSSCKDPACTLRYVEHLTFQVSAAATPTRTPHAAQSIKTEKRWERDHEAFKTLYKQGYDVPSLDGAACRADNAKTDTDIEQGHVVVDWSSDK